MIRLISFFIVALCCFPTLGKAVEQPNIVLLYADDAGYADFGFQDETDPDMRDLTPHIDSIAAAGARFTNAYMSGCVCSPARAGMLTGRYQQRFGHEMNIPVGYMEGGLPLTETMLAERLRTAGYRTAIIGKWHLGYPEPYQPNRRGFDHFFGLLQGARPYFAMRNPTPHRVIQRNGEPTDEGGYVTSRFGRGAVRFITNNKNRPFFLFLSFTAPHGPLQAKEQDLAQLSHIEDRRRRTYAAMVKSMDDSVGLVLDALLQHGIAENTLVVFTNDNGGQTLTGAINHPLKGRKGTLWEGGVRVPLAIQWPTRIEPGQVVHDPVISLDFAPTFLAAAGAGIEPQWKLDGANLLPRITGEVETLDERPLFWRHHGPNRHIALRLGDWKLIVPDRRVDTTPQLYNLTTDIGESTDLAAEHPEKVAKLQALLSDWEAQLVQPLWQYRTAKVGNTNERKRGQNQ